jgi:hypothetical protein
MHEMYLRVSDMCGSTMWSFASAFFATQRVGGGFAMVNLHPTPTRLTKRHNSFISISFIFIASISGESG